MLVHSFTALLICSGVLTASALKLATFEGLYDSVESTFDLSNVQQIPFGAAQVLSQEDDQMVLEMEQMPYEAEGKTIYQVLSDNPEFSRLVKLINFNDDVVSLLNDSSADVTFFAPPNRALRSPHGRKHHCRNTTETFVDDPTALFEAYNSYGLPEFIAEIEDPESCLHIDSSKDKEHRRQFMKLLVKAILNYHVIPKAIDIESLTQNSTYATNLVVPDDALDRQALRVRVSTKLLPPRAQINFFSTVVKSNIDAKNGIVHAINHPLLPPPSIFQEIFLAPGIFGTVTSGLQRVGLTSAVEWRYVLEEGEDKKWTVEGTGSTTFFVPSNHAFKSLPWKLRLFLFSPFGEKVLKKLLQYHVVPDIVLHSDYLYNATSGEAVSANAWPEDFDEQSQLHHPYEPVPQPSPQGPYGGSRRPPLKGAYDHPCMERGSSFDLSHKPVFSANVTLPTLLPNHTLHVHVAKFKQRFPIPGHKDIYTTKLFVNDESVAVSDVVSRNGAVHIINKVLNPRPRYNHPDRLEENMSGYEFVSQEKNDEWEDWETWLPQWVAEN